MVNRYRAAGIHLLFSMLIACIVMMTMLLLWYPGAYFKLMGGTLLFFLLVGVDVCLGPLITLIIFKVGKKGLLFDLIFIATVQLCALLYGMHTMFVARPAFVVFQVDKFRVAAANDIDDMEYLKARQPQWKNPPLTGPKIVAADPPRTKEENNEISFAAFEGKDWHQFPKLWVPYNDRRSVVIKAAKPLSELRKISSTSAELLATFLSNQAKSEENFLYLPLRARWTFSSAIIDATSADIVEIIPIDPYEFSPQHSSSPARD